MDVEKILEELSPEERLALLERLIKGESEPQEEELSLEERVTRLEQAVLGRRWGFGPWWARRPGPRWAWGEGCGCPCCG